MPIDQPPALVRPLSVGLAAGNGVGAGLELGARPGPHVAFTLQAGRLQNDLAGFGLAPALRLTLGPADGPYLAAGGVWFQAAGMRGGRATSQSGLGAFGALGWAWRPLPDGEVYAGAGIGWLPGVTQTQAGVTTTVPGGMRPNMELGIRWLL
jgi:hypothetical protein